MNADRLTERELEKLHDFTLFYKKHGPEKNPRKATSALQIEVDNMRVDITEWTCLAGYLDDGSTDFSRQDASTTLTKLLGDGPHRGIYSGDDKRVGVRELLKTRGVKAQRKIIVAAAISWIGYYGGDESRVDELYG
jgi:hypothetical protein